MKLILAEKIGFDENDSMLDSLEDVDPGVLIDSFVLNQAEDGLMIEGK